MIEVCFYHLTRRSLDQTLPLLLEKSLSRGWRVAVQLGGEKRLKALNDHLWSFDPEKFLPHGTKAEGEPETQPIYLTIEGDNPNDADVRFFVDGAIAAPVLADPLAIPKIRAVMLFDGSDPMELQAARSQWKELRALNRFELVYTQEDERGGWKEGKREKPA